jgi:hypothetical protein
VIRRSWAAGALVAVTGCATAEGVQQYVNVSVKAVAVGGPAEARPPRSPDQVAVYTLRSPERPHWRDYAVLAAEPSLAAMTSDPGYELTMLRARAGALGCDGLLVWPFRPLGRRSWNYQHGRYWSAVCQVKGTSP